VIHVTVRYTMTNRKPSTRSTKTCTGWAFDPWYGWYPYTTTCTYRTDWYYFSTTLYVESDAKNIKVTPASGTATLKSKSTSGNWREMRLKFSPLYYGQTRVISYSYDLPAGGPRVYTKRRAGAAITNFCATGPGTDTGEVRIVLPAGFQITRTTALKQISSSGSTWTWTSGKLKSKPWTWQSCVDGTNPNGSVKTIAGSIDAPVVAVSAWKDDPTWSAAAKGAADDSAKLASVLGALPNDDIGQITIVEAPTGTAPFDPYSRTQHTLTLTEAETDRGAIDDDIASIWFPTSVFREGWLRSAYIRWAESAAGVAGAPCTEPGTPPSATAGNLLSWQGLYMADTHEPLNDDGAYQLNAACWMIGQVADAIGPERMRATMEAMRTGAAAWPAAGSEKRPALLLTWQSWLDILTAQGFIPAGKDPAIVTDLLKRYRIVTDQDHLDARAQALAGYAALGTTTGGKVPASILPAIASWDFTAANTAIDTANRAWTTAASVPSKLTGATVDGGAVQQAVENAKTQADLDAAAAMADAQVALATKVAAALALEAAPRDAVQQIGLIGTVLPADAPAVDAVTKMDAPTATATADQLTAAINGARDVGMQRIELVAGTVTALVLLLLVVLLLRRRRRGRRLAAAASMNAVATLQTAASPTSPMPDSAASTGALETSPAPPEGEPRTPSTGDDGPPPPPSMVAGG
jgi:hypothetical protein